MALFHSSGVSSGIYRFPRFFAFLRHLLLSPARRDIWCRPLPQSRVPSAISSALKPLQLQTPTVSSPLLPPSSPYLPSSPTNAISLPPYLVPCLLLPSPPLLGMARFHSLFPSFHPFPRHRPTTLSFHRSDFLLLVSTDVVPIYIRAGRYRKSNFVTSHQPGQDSAPLFRRNYTLAESRSLERFSLIKPTEIRPSSPLLRDRASAKLVLRLKNLPSSVSPSLSAHSLLNFGGETHEFPSNC